MRQILAVIVSSFLAVVSVMAAANLPVLNTAQAGDATVSGRADVGSGPITIYDISYPAQTALGSSTTMDSAGNFAVAVSPALIGEHEIIAVDANGRSSPPIVVSAPTEAAAGPPQ